MNHRYTMFHNIKYDRTVVYGNSDYVPTQHVRFVLYYAEFINIFRSIVFENSFTSPPPQHENNMNSNPIK